MQPFKYNPNFNSGSFKHNITFQSSAKSVDEDGYPIVEKIDVFSAWAMIKTLQGREFQEANTTLNENTVRFIIRYQSSKQVREDMSIQYRGKIYEIETVLHDDLAMKTVTIIAKETVNDLI